MAPGIQRSFSKINFWRSEDDPQWKLCACACCSNWLKATRHDTHDAGSVCVCPCVTLNNLWWSAYKFHKMAPEYPPVNFPGSSEDRAGLGTEMFHSWSEWSWLIHHGREKVCQALLICMRGMSNSLHNPKSLEPIEFLVSGGWNVDSSGHPFPLAAQFIILIKLVMIIWKQSICGFTHQDNVHIVE